MFVLSYLYQIQIETKKPAPNVGFEPAPSYYESNAVPLS